MRVAIDARKLNGADSGIGSYTLNLLRELLALDADLSLLLVRNGTPLPEDLSSSPRVRVMRVPLPADSPLTPLALGAFLARREFDVFHSPFDLAPRSLSRPLVLTVHDLNWIVNPAYNSESAFIQVFGGAFYRRSLDGAMARAARIVAISNATRRAIVEYAPWHEPKLRVVHNGADTARVRPIDAEAAWGALAGIVPRGAPFVLTVGQGAPYKNHAGAVRGFLRAFADRPDYRLVLVRRQAAADAALDALLATPAARAQVIVLPYVSAEVLNALYNAARVVLHPSYYEGFGLPLVEAMAAGVPLVTSTVSAMPEIAGDAALLASPADPEAIADALRRLDADEPLRASLIAAGKRRSAAFSWRECARATLEVYREAAACS